jgi:hypothetical protein
MKYGFVTFVFFCELEKRKLRNEVKITGTYAELALVCVSSKTRGVTPNTCFYLVDRGLREFKPHFIDGGAAPCKSGRSGHSMKKERSRLAH